MLRKLEKPKPPQCECVVPARWHATEHRCPFAARYELPDGRKVCAKHAKNPTIGLEKSECDCVGCRKIGVCNFES